MYRSRPKGNLDDEVLHFLSSMQNDTRLLVYDVLGSQAHSIMLYETGQLTGHDLGRILAALESARKDSSHLETEGFEDIHEALEAFVIKKAGMESGGKMHTARSRNDQVALDIRMNLRDDINNICAAIADLVEGLIEKAEDNLDASMPMYTHLQQGQIGTFSHFLLAYAYSLMRDLERLYLCYQRINQSPLGACAIGGTSIPIDRKRTAVLLGFDSVVVNSIDATSSRDTILEYAANLSIMASSLSRISEDLIIWSTTEFGFVELSDRFCSTSSAMPQKKNPDPLELCRAKSAIVTSHVTGLLGIVKALPSGYSRDLQEMKPALFAATEISLSMLKIINGVVRTLQVNKEKMRAAAGASYAIALDIAEQLVMEHKVPFRIAHRIVGSLVSKASSKGITLGDLGSDEIALVLRTEKLKLDSKAVRSMLRMTPERSIQLRKSYGSPNPSEQQQMIKTLAQNVRNYKHGVQKRIRLVQGAYENLANEVAKHMKS